MHPPSFSQWSTVAESLVDVRDCDLQNICNFNGLVIFQCSNVSDRTHAVCLHVLPFNAIHLCMLLCSCNRYYPRANGAKRRSGRKPGARVTNFALAEFKVVARGS